VDPQAGPGVNLAGRREILRQKKPADCGGLFALLRCVSARPDQYR